MKSGTTARGAHSTAARPKQTTAAPVVRKDIMTIGETVRQFDTDRPWPATLTDRRNQWLETLATGATVRDRFQLRDKTAIVRLRPSDVTAKLTIGLEMDRFVRCMNEMSYQLQDISPSTPVEVEPWSGHGPRTFYGGAYFLAPAVPEPPDNVNWGRGPGSLKDAVQGPRA